MANAFAFFLKYKECFFWSVSGESKRHVESSRHLLVDWACYFISLIDFFFRGGFYLFDEILRQGCLSPETIPCR